MELPFEKTVCRFWKQKLYNLVNQEETQEVKLPDSMPDVGRIIASWGQVILRGKDWRSAGLGINGGVMVWVLYAPEEGGPLQRVESWIPWKCNVDFPDKAEDGAIRAECVLTSVDARNLSSRKLMLRVGLGLLVQAMVPEAAEVYSPGELPEDVETLNRSYPLVLTREIGEKAFLVDEELELPAGLPRPEQLIYYRMEPEVVDQKVMGSKAVFRGVGNLHVLYLDGEGKLVSQDFEVPFAQYVDLEGEYEADAEIHNLMGITSLELETDPDGGLRLKCGMVGQYIINAESVLELLEDAYSPVRDVQMQRREVEIPAWLDGRQEIMNFSQSFPAEDSTLVDQMFLGGQPELTRQPDGATVELGGSFQTVLQNSDGSYSGKNLHESQNYQVKTSCDTICFARPKGKTSLRKEGSNWRVDTQVVLSIDSLCNKPMDMVTGMELGAVSTPDPERPSVIIRAKGKDQSLWELAKSNGSTVGAIRRMNKLEGEPSPDRLLLIPVI